MKTFEFHTAQFLKTDIHKAWSFFSSPKNLAVITPPELSFKIISKFNDEEIYEGMKIAYIVKPLFGVPLKWETTIGKTEILKFFSDSQTKGPFKLWEHKHTFEVKDNGVLMTDDLKYQLPFGWIGDITHELIVKKKIENIFTYRKEILEKIFN